MLNFHTRGSNAGDDKHIYLFTHLHLNFHLIKLLLYELMTKYYYANYAIYIRRVWLVAQFVVLDLVIGSAHIVKGVCVHHALSTGRISV